jgi:hypothetical protein
MNWYGSKRARQLRPRYIGTVRSQIQSQINQSIKQTINQSIRQCPLSANKLHCQLLRTFPAVYWTKSSITIFIWTHHLSSSWARIICPSVPGHAGVRGNEIANKLARGSSIQKFTGPEASLGVSRQNIRKNINRWVDNQHLAMGRVPCSNQRQAGNTDFGP